MGGYGGKRSAPIAPDQRGSDVRSVERAERHRHGVTRAAEDRTSQQHEIDGLEPLVDLQHGPEEATANLVRATGGLEELPLIVLTQGRRPRDPNSADARVQRGWIELQRHFAERSRRGRHIVVGDSGHAIPIGAPEAVNTAVREIVTEVRRSHD